MRRLCLKDFLLEWWQTETVYQHNSIQKHQGSSLEIAPREDKSETDRQWERNIRVFKRILKRWPEFRDIFISQTTKHHLKQSMHFLMCPFFLTLISLQSSPLLFSLRSKFMPQHLKTNNKYGSHIKWVCPFFPKGGWKVSLFTAVQAQSIKSDMPKTREGKRGSEHTGNGVGDWMSQQQHQSLETKWVWSNLRPPRKPTGEGNGNPL